MTMPWTRGLLAAFDVETTGVDPTQARIVSASVVVAGAAFGVWSRDWLVDPEVDIPADATAVHGISTERARSEGRSPAEALREIAGCLGELWCSSLPVVVFNAPFDLTVVERELERHGLDPLRSRFPVAPVIDPLVIDRHVDPTRSGRRTLGACCETFGAPVENAHDARADALAAARLAWLMARRYGEVGGSSTEDLHEAQRRWHHEWAVDFEARRREQGRDEAAVERGWPVQRSLEEVA